ncbi:MAG: LuxR C-terminal-related transcriptional regulator [Chloroflexota bacterium]
MTAPENQPFPIPLSPFVGRKTEIAELMRLVQTTPARLVALVAPGGMGKTRLALEVATRLEQEANFADGVRFAAVDPHATFDDLLTGIARAVGYSFHSNQPPDEQLFDYLSVRSMVLVLDNLEHLLQESSTFIQNLLRRAPRLVVLITSRERLNLSSEAVYHLKGLALPPLENSLGDFDAIQLFEQTARQVQPGFRLEDANRPQVIRICQLVGGMPLGMILAASWAATLSLKEIADEIATGGDFLQAEWEDLPERHHNLHDVLASTWARLSNTERQSFARLAVFRGGITRSAAQAILSTPGALKILIGKSLVWREAVTGRYHIHELLRQFAEAQLDLSDESSEIRDQHATYFARLVCEHHANLQDHHQAVALREISDDWENVRAAWQHLVKVGAYDTLEPMIEPLYLFFQLASRWAAGEAFFGETGEALMRADVPDTIQARLCLRWAHLILLGRSISQLEPRLLNWVSAVIDHAFSSTYQPSELAFAFYVQGHLRSTQKDTEGAIRVINESLALYRKLDDAYFTSRVLHILGYVTLQQRDLQRCLELSRESAALSTALGDELSTADTLFNIGSVLMWQGNYSEAKACFNRALGYGHKHGSWWRILLSEQCLGSLAFHEGDMATVRTLALRVIETSRNYGYQVGIEVGTLNLFHCLLAEANYLGAWELYAELKVIQRPVQALGLAMAEIGLGDYSAAREHLQLVLNEGNETEQVSALRCAACLVVEQGDLEQAVELLSLAWHHSVSARIFIQRVPLFSNLLAYLETKLPPQNYSFAWERGQALDVTATVGKMLERLEKQADLKLTNARSALEPLSPREREILALVARGLPNQAIADHLVVGVNTIKKHLTHIYKKLGVTSRTQALIRARELRLL